jgi:dihydroorotate dehydrogenase
VQVGTANFVEPGAAARIADEMGAWCDAHGVARASDLVGTLKV